jgi:hypothetical protein
MNGNISNDEKRNTDTFSELSFDELIERNELDDDQLNLNLLKRSKNLNTESSNNDIENLNVESSNNDIENMDLKKEINDIEYSELSKSSIENMELSKSQIESIDYENNDDKQKSINNELNDIKLNKNDIEITNEKIKVEGKDLEKSNSIKNLKSLEETRVKSLGKSTSLESIEKENRVKSLETNSFTKKSMELLIKENETIIKKKNKNDDPLQENDEEDIEKYINEIEKERFKFFNSKLENIKISDLPILFEEYKKLIKFKDNIIMNLK